MTNSLGGTTFGLFGFERLLWDDGRLSEWQLDPLRLAYPPARRVRSYATFFVVVLEQSVARSLTSPVCPHGSG
jgi:hypothetical protein